MKLTHIVILAAAMMLAACAAPVISNDTNPVSAVGGLLPQPIKDKVTLDLQDTEYNFDQASAIGLLPANSPLPACAHEINQQLGIEANPNAPAAQTFQSKTDGIVSTGSVVYLEALRLQAMKAKGISIPQDCVTAWGMIQLQGLSQLFNLTGGLPINITPSPLPAPAAPAVAHAAHHTNLKPSTN